MNSQVSSRDGSQDRGKARSVRGAAFLLQLDVASCRREHRNWCLLKPSHHLLNDCFRCSQDRSWQSYGEIVLGCSARSSHSESASSREHFKLHRRLNTVRSKTETGPLRSLSITRSTLQLPGTTSRAILSEHLGALGCHPAAVSLFCVGPPHQ